MNLPIMILTSLASGIIGVIVTLWIQRSSEIRRQKMDIIRQMAGYRFVLVKTKQASPADKSIFTAALNQAFVIFADDELVMDALREFHTAIVGQGQNDVVNDKLLSLFKRMADSARIDHSKLNDTFFLTPFNH